MIDFHELARVLYFFVPAYLANMSPVFVQGWFPRLAVPIDGGRCWRGKRILGDHKTWRGLCAGIVTGVVVFELQRLVHLAGGLHTLAPIDYADHPLLPGLLMGAGTGVGDAVKSFFKRRIDIAPGGSWPVFDQLDFFAGACAFAAPIWVPPLLPTLAALPVILVGSVATTVAGYLLGLKEAWI
jgi:CDP-2,3-bis-(O-geranylgeranyl)-sn-glycerol synthase